MHSPYAVDAVLGLRIIQNHVGVVQLGIREAEHTTLIHIISISETLVHHQVAI